jgi:hypothetical protein
MRGILFICGLGLFGCAFDSTSGTDGAATEEVGEKSEAVNNWVEGPFRWTAPQARFAIRELSTYLCVLTRVSGAFAGGGESVVLSHDNDFWYIGGSSSPSFVSAEVYCFRRSGLTNPAGASYVSDIFGTSSPGYPFNRCLGAVSTPTWGGDSAFALTGLSGKFEGGGERIKAIQAPDLGASQLSAETCTTQPITAFGYAFFFQPGIPATFEGPSGERGDASAIPQISAVGNNSYAVLAPVGQSFCYFTEIAGAFHGAGEAVQIRPERIGAVDYWVLRTASQAGYIAASARCVSRDQR